MFAEISVDDAETRLRVLSRQVQSGKRFTITHYGKPVADLIPSTAARPRDYGTAIQDMLNFKRIANVDADDLAEWIRDRPS